VPMVATPVTLSAPGASPRDTDGDNSEMTAGEDEKISARVLKQNSGTCKDRPKLAR
jgi:hypothetical protein